MPGAGEAIDLDAKGAQREALHYLYGHVKPAWAGLLTLVLISALATGMSLLQPYLTKILIDDGLIGGDKVVVIRIAMAMLLIAIVSFGLGWFSRQLHVGLSARILFRMREGIFAHLTTLSPHFYASRSRGDLLNRLDGDIAEVQRFATDSMLTILNGIFGLVGALGFMFLLNPKLAMLAFVILPLQVAFLRAIRPRVEVLQRGLRERAGEITGFLIDHLSGMKTVQAFNGGNRTLGALHSLNDLYRGDLLRQQSLSYVAGGVPGLMLTFATATVFLIGGMWVIDGVLQLGTLVAFSAYMSRSTGPVQTFLRLYVVWARARVSLARVWELARQPQDVQDPVDPQSLPQDGRGVIEIENVSFSHAARVSRPEKSGPEKSGPEKSGPEKSGKEEVGSAARILKGAALRVPAGSHIAITGASGAGKSTLIDLLQRHYDPDAGAIRLDGVDIREVSLADLRRAVVVISHDATLFPVSVAENITLGLNGVDMEDVRRAASAAQIDDFISALPDGYDTVVGTEGTDLSTGQRQRIALARAFLRDPRVLVLDEATAAIDDAAAASIEAEIERLFPDRTRIIVTHHAERMGAVDQLYRLAGGVLQAVSSK